MTTWQIEMNDSVIIRHDATWLVATEKRTLLDIQSRIRLA